jgi:hypothetical protein
MIVAMLMRNAAAMAVLLALGTILGAACSDRAPSLAAVRLGMTEQEVEDALGRPLQTNTARCGPNSPRYFIYAGDAWKMESYVYFVGGRVVEVVDHGRSLVANRVAMTVGCAVPSR